MMMIVSVQVIPFCSCSNNQRAVAVVATMANRSLIVLAMAIFCSKVETCCGGSDDDYGLLVLVIAGDGSLIVKLLVVVS